MFVKTISINQNLTIMKKITLFIIALFFGMAVNAQTVLYEDNMESYTVDGFLAAQNTTWWDTWSHAPGGNEDGQIKTTFANSPTKSVAVDKLPAGATDLLLLLGDKVSGAYEVNWQMYVETGKCGYYNFQHFESPGIEWAFELYFRADGTTELNVGGDLITGTYPKDTWFECKHEIDLDADNIKLYINGVMLYEWPFSYQGGSTTGTLQLGGVDFFAGELAGSGEIAAYYFDDVEYKETTAAANPAITLDPTSITTWALAGATSVVPMTVSNTGVADLDFSTNIIYDLDVLKSAPTASIPATSYAVKRTLTHTSGTPTNGGAPTSPDATAQLHYDGDNSSAIGWSSVPITVTVAARFPNVLTVPYAGMNLISVEVYVNDINAGSNLCTVKVYEGGNEFEPGPMVGSQTFTPGGASWETIVLTTPIPVTGADLWVGYEFTQADAGIYIPGCDDGANFDINGDFLSTGVGWSHLSNNPALIFDWNIRANLEGTPIAQWLSVSPASGTITPGNNLPVDVTCDGTLLTVGTYNALLKFLSNDPVNPQVDVPVTFTVAGVGIDEASKLGVMIFPNPAKDVINVTATDKINSISISDFSGKVVYTGAAGSIDISGFASGVYFIQTVTTKGTANTKFVKK
jgi:hypothetical protein